MNSAAGSTEVSPAELRAILADMRRWIRTLVDSYRGVDGKVHDSAVLKEISGIQKAKKLLSAIGPERFPPVIEKGIPLPARQARDCHPKPKWTVMLRRMERTDSVYVPANWAAGIITSAHRIGIRTTRKFIGQKVRIWRTN
jgi:hypothetical protein